MSEHGSADHLNKFTFKHPKILSQLFAWKWVAPTHRSDVTEIAQLSALSMRPNLDIWRKTLPPRIYQFFPPPPQFSYLPVLNSVSLVKYRNRDIKTNKKISVPELYEDLAWSRPQMVGIITPHSFSVYNSVQQVRLRNDYPSRSCSKNVRYA